MPKKRKPVVRGPYLPQVGTASESEPPAVSTTPSVKQPASHRPSRALGRASSEDLVGFAAKGDRQAERELYARYFGRIRGLVRRHLPASLQRQGHSEDLTQEVSLKLAGMLPNLAARKVRYRAWAFRCAINAAISFVRSPYNRREKLSAFDGPDPLKSGNARAQQEDQLLLGQLRPLLRDIKEEHLYWLYLHEVEGYHWDEVAELTGGTKDSVRVAVSRAKKQVREALAAESAGE